MWQFLLLACLILLNGFFAMSELAVVSSRRSRLAMRAEGGDPGAARALALADDPNQFLSSVQIGITLIAILSGVVGEAAFSDGLALTLAEIPALADYARPLASAIVVACIGFISLVFGELVPKRIALSSPETIAAFVARPLGFLAAIGRPFVLLLSVTTNAILRIIGVRERDEAVTEEEVKSTIAEGVAAGAIAPEESRMIEGVLRLADRPVRSIMTPRGQVYWIDPTDDPETIRKEIETFPSSRLVVSEGSIDEPLGVLQKKDLLEPLLAGKDIDVRALVRQPVYVPDGASVLRLLELLKLTPLQIAFVVDEFGSFEGIVTVTDVLVAIAGALPEDHAEQSSLIRQRDDGSYLVDGRTSLDELHETIPLAERPEGEYHTAAGLVLAAFGRIPAEGDSIQVGGWRLEVIDMDGRRIDKVLASRARSAAG
jgi:putative hemolysin